MKKHYSYKLFPILLGLLISFSVFASPATESPSLLLSHSTWLRVQEKLSNPASAESEALKQLIKRLASHLPDAQRPFQLPENSNFEFGWCDSSPPKNRSLKDLVNQLETQSSIARDYAEVYIHTNDLSALRSAVHISIVWAKQSTLLNGYKLGMVPQKAYFKGIEKGFCNRSWNMMLDSIWQSYGLFNFSQVLWIARQNHSNKNEIEAQKIAFLTAWISDKFVPALNSGLHAWTKWADAHPDSPSYKRYRYDNHLPWALVGLAAAGYALNDEDLIQYVYHGRPYDDGVAGRYKNPSHLKSIINGAILHNGEIYDQKIRQRQHKGFVYGHFSLWALTLLADLYENHSNDTEFWHYKQAFGGSIIEALEYYAPYVSEEKPLIDPQEKTDPTFFRFIYRLVLNKPWLTPSQRSLFNKAARWDLPSQHIQQGLGEIALKTP